MLLLRTIEEFSESSTASVRPFLWFALLSRVASLTRQQDPGREPAPIPGAFHASRAWAVPTFSLAYGAAVLTVALSNSGW